MFILNFFFFSDQGKKTFFLSYNIYNNNKFSFRLCNSYYLPNEEKVRKVRREEYERAVVVIGSDGGVVRMYVFVGCLTLGSIGGGSGVCIERKSRENVREGRFVFCVTYEGGEKR